MLVERSFEEIADNIITTPPEEEEEEEPNA
jgi:hypothetical protein